MNLSVKFSLSALAGLIVLLGVLGFLGYSGVSQSTDRTIDERLVMSGMVAQDIDDELSHRVEELHQTAPRLAALILAGQRDQATVELERLYASGANYSRDVFLLDGRGGLVAAVPATNNPPGELVASYAKAGGAIDHRSDVISGSIQTEDGKDSVISLSVPVSSPGGDMLGAVGMTVGPASSFLSSLLPRSGLGKTGYLQVINEGGVIIASTLPLDKDTTFPVTQHQERFAKLIANGQAGVWTCHRCHEPGGEEGGRSQDIMAFSPLTITPWGVAIRQAKSEAFAPRNDLQSRFLLSGAIALAVALVGALVIGGTLSRPLRRLTRASQRIANGDLDYPITLSGKDEVGRLGIAFETMRRGLKQSRQDLEERSRALATLEERDRIARDMHDNLSQTLNYIRLSAGLGKERLAAGDTDGLSRELEQVRQAARDAYEEVRQGIGALRTNGVLERGLLPALNDFVGRYSEQTKLQVRVTLPPSVQPDLSDEAQVQALRIIQEALANVRRHARASRVSVGFSQAQGWVEIRIEDDGVGFDPSATVSNGQHYGLQIMRERAESLGGTIEVKSHPGASTCVIVRLPAAGTAREE